MLELEEKYFDMTEITENSEKKKLSLSRPAKLELKKTVGGGQVRQNFSHGRSKVVAVEVRKKRTFTQGTSGRMAEIKEAPPEPESEPEPESVVEPEESSDAAEGPAPSARAKAVDTLTQRERDLRAKVLHDARRAEQEALAKSDAAIEDDLARSAEEEEKAREAEAEERRRLEEEERRQAEEEELSRQEKGRAAAAAGMAKLKALEGDETEDVAAKADDEEEERKPGRRGKTDAKRLTPSVKRQEPRRRAGKLTIADALDDSERTRSLASVKRARERKKQREMPTEKVKVFREVTIPETITVQELANRMTERVVDVIKSLMKMDVIANPHQSIDADTAELIAIEFGHKVKRVSDSDVEIGLGGGDDVDTDMLPRPPVVTVMGHVDHGKTSLLDALRKTDVAKHEAGGITQHIGACQITTAAGGKITFIDTPGHEAFSAMRARGAGVTDIVVLTVAADDGIMPQTVEAIDHAKAAGVPIIVAINKIDRPDADATRVRTQLLEHELVLETMGGDVLDVEVSATEGINLDKLEEAILLQSEIIDLTANPDRSAEGSVIEAKVEHGRGPVATVLVKRGTVRNGDIFIAGAEWGRVRAMVTDWGDATDEAGPAMPVEIIGLNGVPAAGDDFTVVESEARAREVAEFRKNKARMAKTMTASRGTLEDMFTAIKAGELKELPIIIKADVQGSAEAVVGVLGKIPHHEVKVEILHSGVGGVNESDVTLAVASQALIIGFNVRANRQARDLAERDGVDIRYYSVIYDVVDDVKKLVVGLMSPTLSEDFLGNAEVREVFNISKVGKVAGCYVTDGVIMRGSRVRLLRDEIVIHEGSLSTLKRFKDEAREVREGMECGASFENYHDLKVGDVIECFNVHETAPEI